MPSGKTLYLLLSLEQAIEEETLPIQTEGFNAVVEDVGRARKEIDAVWSLRLDQISCKRGREVVRTEKGKSQGKEGFPGNISQFLDGKWSTWLSKGMRMQSIKHCCTHALNAACVCLGQAVSTAGVQGAHKTCALRVPKESCFTLCASCSTRENNQEQETQGGSGPWRMISWLVLLWAPWHCCSGNHM